MKTANYFLFMFVCIIIFVHNVRAEKNPKNIIIEIKTRSGLRAEKVGIKYKLNNAVGFSPSKILNPDVKGNSLQYTFPVNEPVNFSYRRKTFLAEPGDHVVFVVEGDSLRFKGKGAEKYVLNYKIYLLEQALPKPSNPKDHVTLSEADYLEWHGYLNRLLELVVPLIDSYKNRLSPYAYNYIRARFIDKNFDNHSDKFAAIRWGYKHLGLTRERALELYDTKYKPSTDKYFSYVAANMCGTWKPVWWAVDRKYNFESTSKAFDTELERQLAYLDEGKKIFKGKARELFVYKVLYQRLIRKEGFLPEIESELDAYLSEPDFPEWKAFMQKEVLNLRERLNAKSAPDFTLIDANGNTLTKSNLKGKLAIFDFWFTGCAGCVQMAPQMKKLEEEFKHDTNVVFVNVSVDSDKNKWLKSVMQKKYTTGTGINVYTGGKGNQHEMIKYYGITGYHSLLMIDAFGRVLPPSPALNPRSEKGRKRTGDFIRQQQAEMKDGPYVLHGNEATKVYSFRSGHFTGYTTSYSEMVEYGTDNPDKTLKVSLKSDLINEPSEFARPEKLIVLSDIEGNFAAFRKLLQANRIIDEEYNWIFGMGHLVFAGDMFDRGNQVTECLWLIYSLEQKAKAAGGYVHYVLGNHEIMNLNGNHSYAQLKYENNAAALGKTIKDLFNEDSELGRWLRTKNIMEKVGGLLFVHGGIGLEFDDAVKISISELNSLARKYYDDSTVRQSKVKDVQMIFDEIRGPLWYRRYYEDGNKSYVNVKDSTTFTIHHPTQEQLERILTKWKAQRIITGHTIVADTISTRYNNKVINTDTKHAKGQSEALLIEGTKFYRVNDKGQRWLLFDDADKSKPQTEPVK